MSRRAAPASSGFLPSSGPSARRVGPASTANESFITRFFREEIFAPEKIPGNLSVAVAVTMFVGGVSAVRTWGEMMVPA
ncbi:hypothetical protein BDV98DRAFT_509103 [Pterulicium gracile]|uniref:Uncharacterized protein n=1 Tax=Pterulicium gracile TaxID=1884261 RepID=A0A5C3QE65_9AGAR|nr:hypothetical protein BDV98DRAFT_509103 [Pterula gracilis]